MSVKHLLNDLNELQKEAVTYTDKPLLVLAPAGSGKTKIITYKIAYLIHQGMPPSHIIALTFTNKAADEMKDRLSKLIGNKSVYVQASTFHSYAVAIIRKNADYLGYKENFSIYDSYDTLNVIEKINKKNILIHKNPLEKPSKNTVINCKEIQRKISLFKNSLEATSLDEYKNLYEAYSNHLKAHNAMDFDDLLTNLLQLLRDEKIGDLIRKNIKYLLIDEYQDTNILQYAIAYELIKHLHKITAVGDDDQGIYSFRGSTIENILNFEKDFPQSKIISLEKNYRSSSTIVNAANSLIINNKKRKGKTVTSNKTEGEAISLYEASNSDDEAVYIYEKIMEYLFKDGITYKDIAVLYRNNYQSRAYEEIFSYKELPYKVWGGYNFYSREEVRDIAAYCFFLLNPSDEMALLRIINVPKRGIGTKLVEKLSKISSSTGTSLFYILQNSRDSVLMQNLKQDDIDAISEFYEIHRKYSGQIKQKGHVGKILLQLIDEIGYVNYLQKNNDEKTFEKKKWYLDSFINSILFYDKNNMMPFEIVTRIKFLINGEQQSDDLNKVQLMTVHSAKGLEFRVVFIAAAENGIIPSVKAASYDEIEEERRLFYVALTRAKDKVFISYAAKRMKYNNEIVCYPSDFIDEIDENYIAFDTHTTKKTIEMADIEKIKKLLL